MRSQPQSIIYRELKPVNRYYYNGAYYDSNLARLLAYIGDSIVSGFKSFINFLDYCTAPIQNLFKAQTPSISAEEGSEDVWKRMERELALEKKQMDEKWRVRQEELERNFNNSGCSI